MARWSAPALEMITDGERPVGDAGAAEAAARKLPEVFVGGEGGWHRQRPSHGGERVRSWWGMAF
jgi:hypothetical protein